MVAPACVVIATIAGIVDGQIDSGCGIAVVPFRAVAVSQWVRIGWPYPPIGLSERWRDRRKLSTQIRRLVLILARYLVVPAILLVASLPALA